MNPLACEWAESTATPIPVLFPLLRLFSSHSNTPPPTSTITINTVTAKATAGMSREDEGPGAVESVAMVTTEDIYEMVSVEKWGVV